MKKSLLAASAALLATTSVASAEEQFFFKPNVGINYGFTKANIDGSSGSAVEDQFHSLGVTAGARIHKNFGVEVSYSKSSEEDKTTSTTQSETKFTSVGVDGMFYAPLAKNTEFFTTVGLARYDFTVNGPGGKASDDDIAPRLGAGIKYDIDDKFAIQSSVRHSFVSIGDSDIDIDGLNEFKIGLRYSF